MKYCAEKNAEAQKLWAEIRHEVTLIDYHARQILKKMERYEHRPKRAISLEFAVRKILTLLCHYENPRDKT